MDLTKVAGPKTDFTIKFSDLFQAEEWKAVVVTVPKLTYISIQGTGRPSKESREFMDGMQFLSWIAFSLKFRLKRMEQEGFKDYQMPPVQWHRTMLDSPANEQKWQLNLLQPNLIDQKMVTKMVEIAKMKEKKKRLPNVLVSSRTEWECIQTLHRGAYENVLETVAFLREEAKAQWYELTGRHHEIYLNDSRRNKPDYLETIIRYQVKKA